MKISPLMIALGLGALYLWSKKGTSTAPAAMPASAAAPSSLEQCLKTQDAAACAKLGFSAAGSILNAAGDAIASELKGIDGMAPASLNGHMESLGAFNGLGGSFYGSH